MPKILDPVTKEARIAMARDIFTAYLEKNALRKTQERYEIFDYIANLNTSFAFDELSAYFNENYHVSRATIYNTLNLLMKCNLLVKLQLGKMIKYEKVLPEGHLNHNLHHVICSQCGVVKKFTDNQIKSILKYKPLRGFEVSHYALYLYGLCVRCKKANDGKK